MNKKQESKPNISDSELVAMTKYFSHSEIAEKLGVTRSAISQKLKRIQRDNALATQRTLSDIKKNKDASIAITPLSISARDMVDLASSLLLQEKNKSGVRPADMIKLSESLGRLARMKKDIYEHDRKIVGVKRAWEIVIQEIKKLSPLTAEKIATRLLADNELNWMAYGEIKPEVTKEDKPSEKKEAHENNRSKATFDPGL